jgi:adenosylcobinamide-GDP ribazoletransferase
MICNEIRYFLTAVMFFTRIPCPAWVDHSEYYINKSRKYFPLIGWIVGGASAIAFAFAVCLFPVSIAVILSMIVSVLITGAFHEDGFADVCDAFGGGWGKENILRIMKDSRIGAYGMIGMSLLLLLKFWVLVELAGRGAFVVAVCLLNAHAMSRFIASTFVHTHDYVQSDEQSKSKPIASSRLSRGEMLFSFLFVLAPLLLFARWEAVLILPLCYLPKLYLGYYFKKHIGGYTGDCLGATQQVCEGVFYLTVLGAWKYISFGTPVWM